MNMASEAGLEGSEGQSAYAATKAAVYSYTRSWAKELGKHGVRVVGIAPGIMEATGLRTLSYEEALAYTWKDGRRYSSWLCFNLNDSIGTEWETTWK